MTVLRNTGLFHFHSKYIVSYLFMVLELSMLSFFFLLFIVFPKQ